MRLSVFVSALGWASIVGVSWLWLLGKIHMGAVQIAMYVLFWLCALVAGLWSMNDLKPRK